MVLANWLKLSVRRLAGCVPFLGKDQWGRQLAHSTNTEEPRSVKKANSYQLLMGEVSFGTAGNADAQTHLRRAALRMWSSVGLP